MARRLGDEDHLKSVLSIRALQWSGNPYGNGYGVEMDGNGAQFVKILWIGLDLGQTVDLKRYDRYRTFTKHDISNTDTRLYPWVELLWQSWWGKR